MLSLKEKIGQMLMVGFAGTSAPAYLLDWLAAGKVGGVYLFARNVETPAQVKRLVDSCHAAAKYPILVGIDQEGGAVARLREGFSESPGAMALGAAGDTQLAEAIAFMLGRELAALGINWNFAPVADIAHNKVNPSVGTRSAGADTELVRDIVVAQVKGFQRAGIAATVKHFPGLGNSVIDTHEALAKVSAPLAYMYEADLIPFRAAIRANVACIMTTHVMFEQLDDRYPATLSPRLIDGLLRRELSYDGAVCTDCMEMKAITDGFDGPDKLNAGESAVLAALAGVDILLFSHSRAKQAAAYAALLEAAESGRIKTERIDKSLARIQAIKRRFQLQDSPPLDIVACDAHRSLAKKASRAGTVLIGSPESWHLAKPKSSAARVLCLEFAPHLLPGAAPQTALSRALRQRLPQAECLVVRSENEIDRALPIIEALESTSEALIIATRNAHMQPWQAEAAQAAIDGHGRAILLCLRNPYDAAVISGASAILCSHGDSAPSLAAAVAAICGDFMPAGKLAVNLDTSEHHVMTANSNALLLNTRFKDRLDALLARHLPATFPALSLSVIYRGDIVLDCAYGWIDPETRQQPAAADTLFDLASLTKLIVETSFLTLVADGRVNLQDRLVDVIPEFGAVNPREIAGSQDPHTRQFLPIDGDFKDRSVDVSEVRFQHLLTHSSGLPPWRSVYLLARDDVPTPPAFGTAYDDTYWQRGLENMLRFSFAGPVGESVRYSDIGIMLLGEAVARLQGSRLDQAIAELVLNPLNLSSFSYNPVQNGLRKDKIAPTEYDKSWRRRRVWGEVHDENACGLGGIAGHAGLFATAGDVAAFGQAWLAGDSRLRLPAQLRRAATSQQATGQFRMGLGWMLKAAADSSAGDLYSDSSYGHTGFTGTSLWVDPIRQLVAAVLTNRVYHGRAAENIHSFRRAIHDLIARGIENY